MESLLNYALAFEEGYVVPFVDVQIVDIIEDMTLSNFLVATSRAAYARHVSLAKLIIRQPTVVPLLQRLSRDRSTSKTLGITRLGDPALYISNRKDVVLIINAADGFVNNDSKPALFHASSFYSHAPSLLL